MMLTMKMNLQNKTSLESQISQIATASLLFKNNKGNFPEKNNKLKLVKRRQRLSKAYNQLKIKSRNKNRIIKNQILNRSKTNLIK